MNQHSDNVPQLRTETHFDGRSMACYADRPSTVSAMFETVVNAVADGPALIDERRLSYRELDVEVSAIAAGLRAQGIGVGDRVAIFLKNRWEYMAIVLACIRIGAISVPVSTRLQKQELEFILNDCGAGILIYEDALSEILPESAGTPALRHAYSIEGRISPSFASLLRPDEPVDPVPADEEDAAVILYTSGTTGRPKGAILTHLGIVHSAMAFAQTLCLTNEDRALIAVPMSHVTGLVGVMFSILSVGGSAIIMRESFERRAFLELASRERMTFSILVPTIYTLIALHSDLNNVDLSAWRIGCFGGAPMPTATIEALGAKLPQLVLVNAYGSTETTSPTTIMPISDWRDNMDSVGKLVPCAKVRLVSDDGRDVDVGEPGELLISGPMVVPGYFDNPEANAKEFVDGYWRSGDIGTMDAGGFLRILDRKKDMINRGGFKIYCAEVEEILSHHPAVQECAVVGHPDPVLGERVHVFVQTREGVAGDSADMKAYCAARLSDYKVPETYNFLDTPLPRNNNGKIQKQALRAILANAEGGKAASR